LTVAEAEGTRLDILVSKSSNVSAADNSSQSTAGISPAAGQQSAIFDPRSDPSLPGRMKMQALAMAGVSLLFLFVTISIGFLVPIVRQLLQ
jgi:hypothetical protein